MRAATTFAVVNATTPIWTLLITLAVQRSHVTGRMIVGVLLSFAGVVLVVMGHAANESTSAGRNGLVLGVVLIVRGILAP